MRGSTSAKPPGAVLDRTHKMMETTTMTLPAPSTKARACIQTCSTVRLSEGTR